MRLRLTHPLGAREFELQPTTVDTPIVIGRGAEADVQVPSIELSHQHAALFVHEGDWVLQDFTGGRTFLKGAALDAPRRLAVGDRITFGSDQNVVADVISLEAPIPHAVPHRSIPAAQVPPQGPPPVDEPDMIAEAPLPEPAIAPVSYVPRPRKQSTAGPIVLLVVAGLIIAGSIIFAIVGFRYWSNQQKLAAAPEPEKRADDAVQTSQRKSIFTPGYQPPTAQTPTNPATKPPAAAQTPPLAPAKDPSAALSDKAPAPQTPTPPPAPTPAADPNPQPKPDPWRDSAEWQKVLEAREASSPAVAIFIYMEYRELQPKSPLLGELDGFQQEALDTLWWERIRELALEQQRIDENIAELKKEQKALPASADKDRRAQFDKQIEHLQSQRNTNQLLLEQMQYTSSEPPDLTDVEKLKQLSQQRDKELFEKWSARVLSRIRTTRGASAW